MKYLLLVIAGALPCFAANAAVEATATLDVAAGEVTITHSLTASDMSEEDLGGGEVMATGVVTGNRPLERVALSWDRDVNPHITTHPRFEEYGIVSVEGHFKTTAFPVKLKAVTPASARDSWSYRQVIYTLATPGTQFRYQIVNASGDFFPAKSSWHLYPGNYRMAVSADVVNC
ncbi:hypothetical protein NW460_003919 [Salmonella enterica]|nr:hypothetical protein [Salmonella enterica]ECO1003953.1 hypothetical protein [Salmonella enterica subsp. enterica serovar Give]EDR7365408.1 hypothetical protein [Salmonella enterica subsp. enterica serovar Oslo]EAW8000724.1 hypothetical protein [Salmonella enterica]EBA9710394.1 hypothetical protein [Salmonella enterica]